MKFYDLKSEYLVTDEIFKSRFNEKEKKADYAVVESNLRNYIFSRPIAELDNGAYIEVIKSLKANGDNAQISWVKEESMWCIASKNVGILANEVKDLNKYKNSKGSRYNNALMIAH